LLFCAFDLFGGHWQWPKTDLEIAHMCAQGLES